MPLASEKQYGEGRNDTKGAVSKLMKQGQYLPPTSTCFQKS